VLSVAANPDASSATADGDQPASTTSTTSVEATTTSAPASTTTTGDGEGENGMGMVGAGEGEGALPAQFAPTTTVPPTTVPPSTAPPTTAVDPGSTTTVPADGTTSTTVPEADGDAPAACGASSVNASTASTTTVPGETPPAGAVLKSADGTALYTLGPVGLNGDALSRANAVLNGAEWQVTVAVKGSEKGVANELFNSCYNATPECPPIGTDDTGAQRGAVAIVLDGTVLSAPTVNGPDLAADDFTISGSFDENEAKELALVLRYGSLPVEFEQAALQQVSATLGADSLRAGLIAGLFGILALCIYMIIYYRGFGMVVVVSLMVWGALMYSLVSFLSATQGLALTLAGITGIIVSVGTTVDTYVVVFERIKDEIRNGRSVRSATERGYRSGIKTVFTANGAAFIGAFLLWYLTVGPVRGFAYFLGLSVILDLIVAVAFTRPLILLLSRSPRFATGRFFGVGRATDQAPTTRGVPA
jgi:preprotein translocase subunit SecD